MHWLIHAFQHYSSSFLVISRATMSWLLVLNYLFFNDHSFCLTSVIPRVIVCYTVITDNYKCCHKLQLQTSHFPSLSVSFLLIPTNTQLQFFNLTKTHNPMSLPPILPHPTRDLTSLRNQVRIQIITTITSLVPNFDCLASPAFCHPLSQQLWLNPTTPAPTQLNRRDTPPCSLVSLQNHEPHVPSNTEEQPIRFTSPLALSASSNFSSVLKSPIFSSPSSLLNGALSSSLRKWKQQVPTITPTHLVTLMLLFFPFPPTIVAEGTALLSEP